MLALAAVGIAVSGYFFLSTATQQGDLSVSGTVEATEIQLASEFGGRVTGVNAEEGQMVQAGQVLVEVDASRSTGSARMGKDRVRSPIDGVVLYRSVEPGEVVAPGAPVMTVADLTRLTLTVYVPEDRYGAIQLGQAYPVTVDSFPGQEFTGIVSRISPNDCQVTDQSGCIPEVVASCAVAGKQLRCFSPRPAPLLENID